jgi:hypothetical protein
MGHTMGPAQRYLAAGSTVAVAEAGLGLVLLPSPVAIYLFAVAAATAVFAAATRRLLEPARDDGHGGGASGSGSGSGPTPPAPYDDPPEPSWWPEFEAGLRGYVHDREQRLTSIRQRA